MAETLEIPQELVQEKYTKLFDILQPYTQNTIALPINEGVLKSANELWATLAYITATSK